MNEHEYKICPKCKTKSSGDALFCTNCGYSLKDEPIKVHVENGLYFKRKSSDKVMLFGSAPSEYKTVGPVLARIVFKSRINEDYSIHLEALMNKLEEVIDVNKLDGVSQINITSLNTVVNEVESVSLIVTGNGLSLCS